MKTKLISILAASAALATATAIAGGSCCGSSYDMADKSAKWNKKDIVETAASAEGFSTLVAAVKAAGLVETLQGDGPFTVFAPTDEAFAALPAGTLESLLKPENKAQLAAILAYHVVPAKVMASDVKPGEAPTANGKPLTVSVEGGTVKVNDATVIKTDIAASNGVIHVIDAVMLPPTPAEG